MLRTRHDEPDTGRRMPRQPDPAGKAREAGRDGVPGDARRPRPTGAIGRLSPTPAGGPIGPTAGRHSEGVEEPVGELGARETLIRRHQAEAVPRGRPLREPGRGDIELPHWLGPVSAPNQ